VAKGGRFATLASAQFMAEPAQTPTPLDGLYEATAPQTRAG
jgi:hypothetical protein